MTRKIDQSHHAYYLRDIIKRMTAKPGQGSITDKSVFKLKITFSVKFDNDVGCFSFHQ